MLTDLRSGIGSHGIVLQANIRTPEPERPAIAVALVYCTVLRGKPDAHGVGPIVKDLVTDPRCEDGRDFPAAAGDFGQRQSVIYLDFVQQAAERPVEGGKCLGVGNIDPRAGFELQRIQ